MPVTNPVAVTVATYEPGHCAAGERIAVGIYASRSLSTFLTEDWYNFILERPI